MLHHAGLCDLSGHAIGSLGQEGVDPVADSFLLGKTYFVKEWQSKQSSRQVLGDWQLSLTVPKGTAHRRRVQRDVMEYRIDVMLS